MKLKYYKEFLNETPNFPFPYKVAIRINIADDFVDELNKILKKDKDYQLEDIGMEYYDYAFTAKVWNNKKVQKIISDYIDY